MHTGAYSLVDLLACDNNTLQLYATLISEYHIGKFVASVCPGKVQSLLLVHIAYELAVGTPPKRPPQ